MRVLQLGMGWFPEAPGGANRFYFELVRQLPQVGVEVQGLVMAAEPLTANPNGSVRAVCSPRAPLYQRLWRMQRQVAQAVADQSWSAVAAHFALYTVPALPVLGDLPLVIHFHGPWALEARAEGAGRLSTAARSVVERLVYRRGTRFITLSRAFAGVLHQVYRVDQEQIHVIPGGVAADRFAPTTSRQAARETLGWPTCRPIVLSVRRLVRRMGLEDLISAAALVRHRVPEVLFLIAGTGALELELRARIRSAGLDREMRLIGRLPDEQLALGYRAADLTVVPSVALEGFGLIVPESLAAGTPALVTSVGGLVETVEDLSPDLVFKERGPAGLAAGLIAALEGTVDLPSPEACMMFARNRYDWSAIATRISAVYAEASR
jgi:glycogen synthase